MNRTPAGYSDFVIIGGLVTVVTFFYVALLSPEALGNAMQWVATDAAGWLKNFSDPIQVFLGTIAISAAILLLIVLGLTLYFLSDLFSFVTKLVLLEKLRESSEWFKPFKARHTQYDKVTADAIARLEERKLTRSCFQSIKYLLNPSTGFIHTTYWQFKSIRIFEAKLLSYLYTNGDNRIPDELNTRRKLRRLSYCISLLVLAMIVPYVLLQHWLLSLIALSLSVVAFFFAVRSCTRYYTLTFALTHEYFMKEESELPSLK